MPRWIEIHTARLLPGTDPKEFAALNASLTTEILRVPGLLRRELAHDAERGLWVDVIHWASREAREDAAAVFAANPRLHSFARHLDPATMQTVTVAETVDLEGATKP